MPDDTVSIDQLAAIAAALFGGGAVALGIFVSIIWRFAVGSWPLPRNGRARQNVIDTRFTAIDTAIAALRKDVVDENRTQWTQISQNREDVARIEGRIAD